MPIARESWAPAPSPTAAVKAEISLSIPTRLLKTVLYSGILLIENLNRSSLFLGPGRFAALVLPYQGDLVAS
jgi:hypothetical protein